MQELLDAEYRRTRMGAVPQRRYRDRFFAALVAGAEARFTPLLELAQQCNVPNTTVSAGASAVERPHQEGSRDRVLQLCACAWMCVCVCMCVCESALVRAACHTCHVCRCVSVGQVRHQRRPHPG